MMLSPSELLSYVECTKYPTVLDSAELEQITALALSRQSSHL
jgi:hypothetical protein